MALNASTRPGLKPGNYRSPKSEMRASSNQRICMCVGRTGTGRISSRYPNLQSLPRSKPAVEASGDADEEPEEEDEIDLAPENAAFRKGASKAASAGRLSVAQIKQLGVPQLDVRNAFTVTSENKVFLSVDYSQVTACFVRSSFAVDGTHKCLSDGSSNRHSLVSRPKFDSGSHHWQHCVLFDSDEESEPPRSLLLFFCSSACFEWWRCVRSVGASKSKCSIFSFSGVTFSDLNVASVWHSRGSVQSRA
jgi:hypothetical protein